MSTTQSTIQKYVGPGPYERVRTGLQRAFPDQRAKVTNDHVDAFFLEAWESPDQGRSLGLPPPPPKAVMDAERSRLDALDGAHEGSGDCYGVVATHARNQPIRSVFDGQLAMGRVTLPATKAGVAPRGTPVGSYLPGDHLFTSVDRLAFDYEKELAAAGGANVTRVDCISPMRMGGSRFGAIGLYLGYRNGATTPSFYLLETGFATGPSAVAHLSADLSDIRNRVSGYQPTPMARPTNYYSARLELAGEHPTALHIEVRNQPSVAPHMEVTVQFTRSAAPSNPRAFWLLLQAGGRVGLIADVMGLQADERIFAPLGATLPWKERPTRV